MPKALEVVQMMEDSGVPQNRLTYTMLINGYVHKDDSANAFKVYEEMTKARLKPDVITYNVLINP